MAQTRLIEPLAQHDNRDSVAIVHAASYVPAMTNRRPSRNIELTMESPCVKICVMDEITGLCTGCGRTRGEIAMWSSTTDSERRRIMAELASRQRPEQ